MKKTDDSREYRAKVIAVAAAVLMAAAAIISGMGALKSVLNSFSKVTVADGAFSLERSITPEQLPLAAALALFSAAGAFVVVKQVFVLVFSRRTGFASFAAYTIFWAAYIAFFSVDAVSDFLMPELYMTYRAVPVLNINLMQFDIITTLIGNNMYISRLVIIIGYIMVTIYRMRRTELPSGALKSEKAIDKN